MRENRDEKLGKALKWSLALHVGIASFAFVKSVVFPSQPVMISPSLRVDMVGLPDILKKDLAQVSKTLPQEAEKEKAPPPAEAAKPKAAEVETAKPDEMVLNAKKAEKKKKEEAEKEAAAAKKWETRLQSALARIRSLERLKDTKEEDDDSAIIIKGNQISKGTSLTGDARENAQAGYYDLVRETLVEFWSLPPWLARQNLSAQVVIQVDPAGTVFSTRIIRPSGNEQFDAAILATIREAQPLPRPPKDLHATLRDNGITVGFPL
jgi:colicin import membrane protein